MAERTVVFLNLDGVVETDTFMSVSQPVSFLDLAGSVEDDVLGTYGQPVSFLDLAGSVEDIDPFESGGSTVTVYYHVRVLDSGTPPPAGYREWLTTDPESTPPPPPPVGTWVDRTVLAAWSV